MLTAAGNKKEKKFGNIAPNKRADEMANYILLHLPAISVDFASFCAAEAAYPMSKKLKFRNRIIWQHFSILYSSACFNNLLLLV